MDLSIIIPVYQVEQYIRPCMESIFRQGLEEERFEVIIINDGTKDRSMEMIQDIVEAHANVTVVNQENQGLSVVRNNGIAMAKGEYLLMPDSDDLLIENALPTLLDKALETKADLVVADFLEMTDEEIDAHNHTEQVPFVTTEKSGYQLFLDDLDPYQCYVWRTLFRTAFLRQNNMTFVPGVCFQDVPFTHECYLKAQTCIRTPWLLNIYRRGHESATFSFSQKKAHDFCIVIQKTWELMKMNGLPTNVRRRLEDDVYTSFNIFYYSMLHSIKQHADRLEVVDYFKQLNPHLQFSNSLKRRIESLMLRTIPHFYLTIREWHWLWIRRHDKTER